MLFFGLVWDLTQKCINPIQTNPLIFNRFEHRILLKSNQTGPQTPIIRLIVSFQELVVFFFFAKDSFVVLFL